MATTPTTPAPPKTAREHARDLRTEAQRLDDVAKQMRHAARILDPRGRPPVAKK